MAEFQQHDDDINNNKEEEEIRREEVEEETPIQSEELTQQTSAAAPVVARPEAAPLLSQDGDDDEPQQLLRHDQQQPQQQQQQQQQVKSTSQQPQQAETTTAASTSAVVAASEVENPNPKTIEFDVQGVDPVDYDWLYSGFKSIVPLCIVGSCTCLVVMPLINYTTRIVWMWIVLWVQLVYAYVGFSQCNNALIAMYNVKHVCLKYSTILHNHQHQPGHKPQQREEPPTMSHVFIIPNYNEPEVMLEETLRFLSTHVLAQYYTIVLAMEDTEIDHSLKANRLIEKFTNQFHRVIFTTHILQSQVGEARGKASNESWACRYVSKEVELFPQRYASSICNCYETKIEFEVDATSENVLDGNNVVDPDYEEEKFRCCTKCRETFCSDKVMIHILDADAHVHGAYTQEVEETCQHIIQEHQEESENTEYDDGGDDEDAGYESDWGPNLWVHPTTTTVAKKKRDASSHGSSHEDDDDNQDDEEGNFLSSPSSPRSRNQEDRPPLPGSVVRSIFAPPVIMSRNVLEVPWLTRMQDTSWSAVALQNLTSLSKIGFPLSNYSFSLRLVEDIGFFDTNAEAITEDFHFFSKAFFKTNGAVHLQPIFVPANMLNLNTDGGWFKTVRARFVQAERHGRVVTEFAYALRQAVKRRPRRRGGVDEGEGLSRKYEVLWETFIGVAFPPIMPAYLAIAGPLCLILEIVYKWFSVSPTLLLLVLWTESFGAVCAVIIGCQLYAFDAATRAANTHLYNKPNLSMKDTFLPLPLIFFDLWIYVVGAFVVASIRSILPSKKNRAFVVSKKMATSCTTRPLPESP